MPGNRAHVDLLFKKFDEGDFLLHLKKYFKGKKFLILDKISDPNIVIQQLDIPVNAVATALKDFFSKRLPPLFDEETMQELEDIAGKFHS